ncbi:hypothetical protein NQ318_021978 [Aromia moschata]|uniref:Probable galactose-1-phosphate uridylyltransferase n=1 Tax=Aromia moschata TaxID=1265417 RepID=A0AAV8Z6W3_9CUCU|nr:hypothetical protein NQ318_021978 [Aromia moschata]
MEFNTNEHQHLRYNPLKDEWILVSPHRSLRPWSGPNGNATGRSCAQRASGIVTPQYESTYVFTNDFPALLEEGPEPPESDDPLFQIKAAKGTCKVICYHPHSNVYLTSLTVEEVVAVINEWIRQTSELGKRYLWVQVFENRGSHDGLFQPPPALPDLGLDDLNLRKYYEKHGRPMLQDYVQKELKKRERIVYENCEWLVVVPFWACWPFETMVLPKRQIQRFTDVDDAQKVALAHTLQALVAKYDNLFKCNFPYSMGWHGAPTGDKFGESHPHWTFHGLYYPPLLRSATVKKFMVGYELLAQEQRDLTPEKAAATLREQSEKRFS